MTTIDDILDAPRDAVIGGVPDGLDALALGDLARALFARHLKAASEHAPAILHIARDDRAMAGLAAGLSFFAPDVEVVPVPAWDCLPYDRSSPAGRIVAARLAGLARLMDWRGENDATRGPLIVLTTVNAALQRVTTPEWIAKSGFSVKPGNRVVIAEVTAYLETNGYTPVSTVMEPGDFAVRGGIIDLFAPGTELPVRLDLFGDTLESIRSFDPQSQRTIGQLQGLRLVAAAELTLDDAAVRRFREGYVARFGPANDADPLYEAVSAHRRFQGMEHWLPLFHESLASLFDYLPGAMVSFDAVVDEVVASRREQIADYYKARADALEQTSFGAPPYKPLKPNALTLSASEWTDAMSARMLRRFTPFRTPDGEGRPALSLEGRAGRSFAAERAQTDANVFDAAIAHISALQAKGTRVVLACWSHGARERLAGVLTDHGAADARIVAHWHDALALPAGVLALAVLGLETGFEAPGIAIIGEQDILGDRLVRPRSKRASAADVLLEAGSLNQGDLVVHVDHGIGRFEGLQTIDVQGAPHDCLHLTYQGGRLFLPVENIELLSRYGSDEAGAQLDRLGGAGWQARKARLKQRIREIAESLIKTAAARELRQGEAMPLTDGLYSEFCARFPFEETEDQARAVEDVLGDLASGRPMDRLVCGDVGFGKTEVALRSAFAAVMAGKQVAVVAPTTLLARQHYETFTERFRDFPVRIGRASRLVPARELTETFSALSSGEIDIVIGTHALLGKRVRFRDLGLLIVDEEQHFGVTHKERLKEIKANVHVLTLTATPIPRTLQMALSGVRELSLIATPPVDRLAVRTFISPFDPVVIREALLRERYRGGQSFYVAPRVSDLAETETFLRQNVPELRIAVAHGQMAPGRLEDVMSAFYDREYDVLLSTTIIESGLDIPSANTLIVHRSDMFGLAQLYQLRGRVGRSKLRAYALFTVPVGKTLTAAAEKRLRVLQSLDGLGAGFNLASHDLDIRGAGNLLGEEQSGHIREVGLELYQSMLEEMVASLREGGGEMHEESQWSPQINIGAAVLIPERFVPDLDLRLALYRRLANAENEQEIDAFAAEMIDRFGALPGEVEDLLRIVAIKALARRAGIAQVDAGPKGVVLGFRNERFANPAGLVAYISAAQDKVSLRPDHRLVVRRDWPDVASRLKGVKPILQELARIAEGEVEAA